MGDFDYDNRDIEENEVVHQHYPSLGESVDSLSLAVRELNKIVGRQKQTYETYYSQEEINNMKNTYGNIGSDIIQNGAKLGMVRTSDGKKIRGISTFTEHDYLIDDKDYYDHLEDILDEDAKERYRQDLLLRPSSSVDYVQVRPSLGDFLALNRKYLNQSDNKSLLFPSNKKDNVDAVNFLKVSNANYVNDVVEFETPF